MTRKQCKKCPWKTSTNPYEIPNGYCAQKHKNLKSTIAEPGSIENINGAMHLMACHEAATSPCVGWLHNQLGIGNNIALRLAVVQGKISADFEIDGEQHETLEDTLPKEEALNTETT